jgi:TRAP-type C4-dicarboxylate transport system permease small subunit
VKVAYIEKFIYGLARWLNWLGCIALLAMMVIVGCNVFLRPFGVPILGTYEFVEFLMVAAIGFGIAYTAAQGGHISVSLLVSRFPASMQAAIDCITTIFSLVLFCVVTWQMVIYGMDLWQAGEVSYTLKVPISPYIFGLAFGLSMLSLVLLVDVCKLIIKLVKK